MERTESMLDTDQAALSINDISHVYQDAAPAGVGPLARSRNLERVGVTLFCPSQRSCSHEP